MAAYPVVLLYNLNQTEKGRKIKYVCIRLGIRIKNITSKDFMEPIGFLAGIKGITSTGIPMEGEGFRDEMLVMYGFSEKLLDALLLRFRKEKIPKILLKAVITETNQTWTSLKLYKEIKKEHKQMEEMERSFSNDAAH